MSDIKLRHCPFCGSGVTVRRQPLGSSFDIAVIDAWNRRAGERRE